MRRLLGRGFSRLYNPIKPRLRSAQKVRFQSRFGESPKVKAGVAHAMQIAKANIKPTMLSSTLGKTAKEMKATDKAISFKTTADPAFEKDIRRFVVSRGVTAVGEAHLAYMQQNLLLLDQSVESRRNVLLVEELENYQKKLRDHKEMTRRKELQAKAAESLQVLGPEENIDRLLSRLSDLAIVSSPLPTDQPHSLVPTAPALPIQSPLLIHTTSAVISSKGVIDLTGRTTGHLSFNQLTHRELGNYICYNLLKREEALALFASARESDQFDVNLRASLVQKIAVLHTEEDIIEDKRFKDLLGDINRSVSQLSHKNIADSLRALGKLYRGRKETGPLVDHLIHSLCDQVSTRIEELNGLHLAYICDGLFSLKLHLPGVTENVMVRLGEVLGICEQMSGGEREKEIEPWKYQITTQPSLFYGYEDRTVPKYPLTAQAIDLLTRYLSFYPYYDSPAHKVALLTRCASVLSRSLTNELTLSTALSLFRTFGRDEIVAIRPEVQSLFTHLATSVFPQTFSLDLAQTSEITQAVLNSGLYRLSRLYEELEFRAKAVLASGRAEDLVNSLKVWGRLEFAFGNGVDPGVDLAYFLLPSSPVMGSIPQEYLRIINEFPLSDSQQLEVAQVFALLGHRLDFHPALLKGIQALSKSANTRPALFMLQAAFGDIGFREDMVAALPRIMSCEPVRTQVQVLTALAHLNTSLPVEDICTAIRAEMGQFQRNKEIVPCVWAISALGSPDAETLRLLLGKVNFSALTKLETVLLYQVYLTFPDLLSAIIPASVQDKGPLYLSDFPMFNTVDMSDRVVDTGKLVGGYYVQYYDIENRTVLESVRKEGRLKSGEVSGLLRVRETHLRKAGVQVAVV